jgi:hypothetical protein
VLIYYSDDVRNKISMKRMNCSGRCLAAALRPDRLWASHPLGIGGFCPEVRWQGREAGHLPVPNAEVKDGGAIPSRPYISSSCGA